MNADRIGGIVVAIGIVVFSANIFLNEITAHAIGGNYMHIKTDFPFFGDREVIFMGKDKDSEFKVKGIFLPFSWKANGVEISEKKGIYFIDKERVMPYEILSTPQREMFDQAVYYLEQGDKEKALVLLIGLEVML